MTAGAWTSRFEDLLHGLVHAMNNRLTALSAFAELAAMDGEAIDEPVVRQEVTCLHQVSKLIGVLATRYSEVEALELRGVLETALTIHLHHPRTRTVSCTIEQHGLVLPVRVPRSALLRLLLLMVDLAKREGTASADGSVVVRLSGDEQVVRADIVSAEPLGNDAENLAAQCGGVVTYDAGRCRFELPSLVELRRREKLQSVE